MTVQVAAINLVLRDMGSLTVELRLHDIHKSFKCSDSIKVISRTDFRWTGIISIVNDDDITFIEDHTKEHVQKTLMYQQSLQLTIYRLLRTVDMSTGTSLTFLVVPACEQLGAGPT